MKGTGREDGNEDVVVGRQEDGKGGTAQRGHVGQQGGEEGEREGAWTDPDFVRVELMAS